jgi:hypothetical protein
MPGEHLGTIGDFQDPTYSDSIVKRWNQKTKRRTPAEHVRR